MRYRLPVLDGINKETEELARKHCKYSQEAWVRDWADFQSQWERIFNKRESDFAGIRNTAKFPTAGHRLIRTTRTPGSIQNERWRPRYQRSSECFGRCCSTDRITN